MGSARGITHRWIDVGGLRLHCVEAGTGPLVVLLHGFPEFWYAWRHQLPALADAGYRVVAPDLPGYNTSDKPPRVRDYRPSVLAQDVADLIMALGAGSAAVAGHDWGGGLAWLLAMQHPQRVERLVLLNAPHPVRFLKGLRSLRQLRRSWYILAFQLPWLPERLLRARDLAFIEVLWRLWSPSFDDHAHVAEIRRSMAEPGVIEATLAYYRAMFRAKFQDPSPELRAVGDRLDHPIETPTRVLCGSRDMRKEMLSGQADLFRGPYEWATVDGAGHFLHRERPDEVNRAILDWLGRS